MLALALIVSIGLCIFCFTKIKEYENQEIKLGEDKVPASLRMKHGVVKMLAYISIFAAIILAIAAAVSSGAMKSH